MDNHFINYGFRPIHTHIKNKRVWVKTFGSFSYKIVECNEKHELIYKISYRNQYIFQGYLTPNNIGIILEAIGYIKKMKGTV